MGLAIFWGASWFWFCLLTLIKGNQFVRIIIYQEDTSRSVSKQPPAVFLEVERKWNSNDSDNEMGPLMPALIQTCDESQYQQLCCVLLVILLSSGALPCKNTCKSIKWWWEKNPAVLPTINQKAAAFRSRWISPSSISLQSALTIQAGDDGSIVL